jgi:N-acetyl-gamma-glutamyl-phosphate reductase
VPADLPLSIHAVSGYSGKGREGLEQYEGGRDAAAFTVYGLGLAHKHVPEMQRYAALTHPPLFAPAVIDAHRGMVVEVPLPLSAMPMAGSPEVLRLALVEFYTGSQVVTIHDEPKDELLRGAALAGHAGRRARKGHRLDGFKKPMRVLAA